MQSESRDLTETPLSSVPGGAAFDATPILEARQITRRFGAFVALQNVDFVVRAGEIHALLGENGAGKSTLMNILSGLLSPTEGSVALAGNPVRFRSPADASAQGVGMVHQHFLLVPTMTVVENLMLSASRRVGGAFTYPQARVLDETKAVADRLGWQIPWEARAGDLPVGTQQRIEILKALRGETRVLIFDEPTAVLTPSETPELFENIRNLARAGTGIVFISHKLDEVLALSQQITVLRRGQVVLRTEARSADISSLAHAMVGAESEAAAMLTRADISRRTERTSSLSPRRLAVADLSVVDAGRRPVLDNVTFDVAGGEIFGIAGVDGNGQNELAECLAGLRRPNRGIVKVDDTQPEVGSPVAFADAGVAVIPADRQTRGLAMPMSLTENFALGVWRDRLFRHGGILMRWPRIRERAEGLIRRFDIRATGASAPAESLSGGNQQKVVIARALADKPRVVVAVNPTRGLDVGAIAYVHEALRAERESGAAIVLLSTELDEVCALSDRIAVLYSGRFVDIVGPDTPRERFGLLMGGGGASRTEPKTLASGVAP